MNKAGEEVAKVEVPVDRYVYFATEDAEVDVPIINKKRMCRNGCCTTCAVKVLEGKVSIGSGTQNLDHPYMCFFFDFGGKHAVCMACAVSITTARRLLRFSRT